MPKRGGEVATAADSIVAYEQWRISGDQHILDEIEDYNAIDCRSTAALRDWLLSIGLTKRHGLIRQMPRQMLMQWRGRQRLRQSD